VINWRCGGHGLNYGTGKSFVFCSTGRPLLSVGRRFCKVSRILLLDVALFYLRGAFLRLLRISRLPPRALLMSGFSGATREDYYMLSTSRRQKLAYQASGRRPDFMRAHSTSPRAIHYLCCCDGKDGRGNPVCRTMTTFRPFRFLSDRPGSIVPFYGIGIGMFKFGFCGRLAPIRTHEATLYGR